MEMWFRRLGGRFSRSLLEDSRSFHGPEVPSHPLKRAVHPHATKWKVAEMSKEKEVVRIDLTNTQKQAVKKETGKDAPDTLELTITELEDRIAPLRVLGN